MWFQKNKKRLKNKSIKEIVDMCIKETKGGKTQAYLYASELFSGKNTKETKTIDDFKNNFDVNTRVKKAIESLPDDGYISNKEMAQISGVGLYKLSLAVDDFQDNVVKIRNYGTNSTFWAKKKMILQMRKVLCS